MLPFARVRTRTDGPLAATALPPVREQGDEQRTFVLNWRATASGPGDVPEHRELSGALQVLRRRLQPAPAGDLDLFQGKLLDLLERNRRLHPGDGAGALPALPLSQAVGKEGKTRQRMRSGP